MELPVSPVDQTYEVPPAAVKVTAPPVHSELSLPVKVNCASVKVMEEDPEHPLSSVYVTSYVPGPAAKKVGVVTPPVQLYVEYEFGKLSVVPVPEQIGFPSDEMIVSVGMDTIVTIIVSVETHPVPSSALKTY